VGGSIWADLGGRIWAVEFSPPDMELVGFYYIVKGSFVVNFHLSYSPLYFSVGSEKIPNLPYG
jgi:hypothetical protein